MSDVSGVLACRRAEAVLVPPPRPRVQIEAMAGRWIKTSDGPQWIESVEIDVDGDDLLIHPRGGAIQPSPRDWGVARSEVVYAGSMLGGDARAGAFVARFELDGMSVELQGNLNLGLLVVASFVSFRQPAPFTDRFTREFFRR